MTPRPVACPPPRPIAPVLPIAAVLLAGGLLGTSVTGCADYPFGEPRLEPTRTDALDRPPVLSPPPCQVGPPPAAFVGRDGPMLVLEGRRFRAVGANLYYLQQLFTYGNAQFVGQALAALDRVVCAGLPVVRAWGFNESKDSSTIHPKPTEYNERGLRGLDRLVAEAKSRGLRVILAMANNHAAFGGLPVYARWAGKEPDDFFGDPQMMGYWKDYVSTIANRVNTYTGIAYKDEPALLAIELGNEFRCRACRGTTRLIDAISEMATFAQATFPNHLIADGGEGFDDTPSLYPGLSNPYVVRGDEGASFSKLVSVEGLDMLSYHLYPDGYRLDAGREVNIWIDSHELLARMAGKVAYLGEFGYKHPIEMRDEKLAPIFNAWLSQLFDRRDGHMGLLWQWAAAERQAATDDGYTVVFEQHPLASAVLSWWAGTVAGLL